MVEERKKIPFIQSSKLIQLTTERQEHAENMRRENPLNQYCRKDRTQSCRLSSSCKSCSQLRGLQRTFISVAAPSPADWGKTGNWNMEGNEDWSFTKIFFWHATRLHNPSSPGSY